MAKQKIDFGKHKSTQRLKALTKTNDRRVYEKNKTVYNRHRRDRRISERVSRRV